MKKLYFTSLKVRKAPGFREGISVSGFDDLSPEINIIAGPNGAGKSTTGRTILNLIWPDKKNKTEFEASARFDYENNHWTEHLSPGEIKIQKNGIDTILPERPSEDSRKIYMLALHDLVKDSDKDLAERIVVESLGGVNLDKAGENLGFSADLKRGASKEYNKALENYRQVEAGHQSLESREKTLTDLKLRKDESLKAGTEKDFYILAGELLHAKNNLDSERMTFESFPKVLEKLNGNEIDALDSAAEMINRENRNILNHEEKIRESETELRILNLPAEVAVMELTDRLSDYAGKMKDLETKLTDIDIELKNLRVTESLERGKIGNTVDENKLKEISICTLGNIEEFYRKTLVLKEKQMRLGNEILDIENETGKRQSKTTEINSRLFELQSKSEHDKTKGIPAWIIILVAVLGIATAMATLLTGKAGLTGIVLIISVTVWGILGFIKEINKTEGQSSFKQMEELQKELATEILRDERLSRRSFLACELRKVEDSLEDLRNIKQKITEELGELKILEETPDETDSTLFLFLSYLQKWQKIQSDIAGKLAERTEIEDLLVNSAAECNAVLRKINIEPVKGSTDIFTVCKTLARKETSRASALSSIKNSREQITICINRMHENALALKSIYEKIEVPFGERESAGKLLELYPSFVTANEKVRDCERSHKEKQEKVMQHSLYSSLKGELQDLDLEAIQKKITSCNELSGELHSLNEQIAGINAEIKQKKNGNELEAALAEKNKKHAELAATFDRNLSSITGSLLLQNLKAENDKKNRPEVLKRADSLFNIITAGRYNLIADGDQEPRFRAVDSTTGEGVDLDNLSTATRVQLLLSVRIAFIELLEGDNIRLPLIADELLANSDEIRAEAIVSSLYKISKQGRQIFYMTAQEDEINRWRNFLEGKGEPSGYKIINLYPAELKYDSKNNPENKKAILKFTYQPPEPDGMTVEEYRRKINARPFDLMTDKPEQLSVAYLVNDCSIVYDCLKRGIDSWGMLSTYCSNDGCINSISKEILENMKNKSVLLSDFQELYRPGRPKKVGMDVIMESGRVKEKYIEQVKDKLNESKGNPEYLLKILPDIPKFKRYVPELEEHFRKNGYIDDAEPLPEDMIRIRLQARIEQLGLDQDDSEKFINSILSN